MEIFAQLEMDLSQWTSSVEASPASPSLLRDVEKAQPTSDGYGLNTSVSFAQLSPDGSGWKMYQVSYQWTLDGSLEEYSETWPQAGMMRNGICYLRSPLVPRTSVIGYSSWPTPTVGGSESSYEQEHILGTRHALNLHRAVRLWPTPTADDAHDATKIGQTILTRNNILRRRSQRGTTHSLGLKRAVRYPTPRANKVTSVSFAKAQQRLHKHNLADWVATPVSGSLNPTWVEWLMGFPLNWTEVV